MPPEDTPWYREGLRFRCTGCGACCRGQGRVEVSDLEIERLAAHQDVTDDQFRTMYTRTGRKGTIELRDKRNHDCIFYDPERGCTVYEARPTQCRTYPFWRPILTDEETWQEESTHCEGINQGPVVTVDEIRRHLEDPN